MAPSRRLRLLRRCAVGATAAAAVLVTSGCALFGGASTAPDGTAIPSVRDLYKTVRASALGAKSAHVTGFVTSGGEAVTIDIEGRTDGSNQRAKIDKDKGGSLTLTTVKGKYYVAGNWDFWAAATEPKRADGLVGRQVRVAATEARTFSDLTIGSILGRYFERDQLPLVGTFGSSITPRHQDDKDFWVMTQGGHEMWVEPRTGRLLKIVSTGEDPAELTFSGWDEARTFAAPSSVRLLRS